MEWSDSLSIGIDTIDNQHKELINRINALYATLRKEASKIETLRVLLFLSSYVETHFRDEEAIQMYFNYPKYAEHKKMHMDFIETVKDLNSDIEDNGVTAGASTMVAMTLSNWLVSHISVQDMDIGQFLKKNHPSHGAENDHM